jgi:DNA-binding SARP family transcriptional activator
MAVWRRRILGRFTQPASPIVEIVAPGGYGKTVLARQIAQGYERVGICDCLDVTTEQDFCDRILVGLAHADPNAAPALNQLRFVPAQVGLLIDAWTRTNARSVYVFDNAEAVLKADGMRNLYRRLVTLRPESRTLVTCSRVDLGTHGLPASVHLDDLTFDREEIAEMLPGLDGKRVAAITRGRAILIALISFLIKTHDAADLLARLELFDWEEIYDYLADSAIEQLTPDELDVLIACAVIPDAAPEDIERARGEPSNDILERLRENEFFMHPLMRAHLRTMQRWRAGELLAAAAEGARRDGDAARAAALFLEMGDDESAVRELSAVRTLEAAAGTLARIDPALVERHPSLWARMAVYRRYRVPADETILAARSVLRAVPPDARASRLIVGSLNVVSLIEDGDLVQAQRLFDDLFRDEKIGEEPADTSEAAALLAKASLAVASGKLEEARAILATVEPFVSEIPLLAAQLAVLAAAIECFAGARGRERVAWERAIAAGRGSGFPNFHAYALVRAIVGDWRSGEAEALQRHLSELQRLVPAIPGQSTLHAAFAGEPITERQLEDVVDLKLRAYAALAAAAATHDVQAKRTFVERALEISNGSAWWFLRILALVAKACLDPESETQALHDADVIARPVASPALRESLEALQTKRAPLGMLDALVRRFRSTTPRERLAISFATCEVTLGGRRLVLGAAEKELLFAIARRPLGALRDGLATDVWPSLPFKAALEAFNTALYRLGKAIDEGRILRDGARYRLADGAVVDLWEFDEPSTTMRRADVADVFRRIAYGDRDVARDWPWFDEVEERLQHLARSIAIALARQALEARTPAGAFEFTSWLLRHDELDEAARELAIRAHLALGDAASARKEYRRYERALRQADEEPSSKLRELVDLAR